VSASHAVIRTRFFCEDLHLVLLQTVADQPGALSFTTSRQLSLVAGALRSGKMPCDGAWPEAQVAAFQHWIDAGKPA
jgi:hypothetical protein